MERFHNPNISKWHIDEGVVGKHNGLSYCEACDFVPYRKWNFDSRYGEYFMGEQFLSLYCPNCGAWMINGIKE